MLEIDESRITPQKFLDFFSCHYRPSALREEQEHVERLRLELYQEASFPEFACNSIQLERAKPKVRRAWNKK